MAKFSDLPVEILPLILGYLPKSRHLASASLVNQTFRTFAIPKLYHRISIYSWHKKGKIKVLDLFSTLANCPHLAQHVRRLEIRDFPKAIIASEENILTLVVKGLQHCTNLYSCTWTRDGTLSSEILGSLCCSQSLREFEFNGHSQGQYDPQILTRFRGLTKISLIMPSSIVISQMSVMLRVSGHLLRHLTVICKTSTVLNDSILGSLAPHLINLQHLYITGCPKVTEHGILPILESNQPGLKGLGLEGLSPKFDMASFAHHCTHNNYLQTIRSITLTVSRSIPDPSAWTHSVLSLLSSSPRMEKFQIYATSSPSETQARHTDAGAALLSSIPQFLVKLVSAHGERLKHFSIHRMPLGLESVLDLCQRCPNLEDLFLVVEPRLFSALPEVLAHAKKLRTVHINYPLETSVLDGDDEREAEAVEDLRPILTPDQMLNFVRRCGPSLLQFGCNTKVWQVGRVIELNDDGDKVRDICLLPYETPDIPEQFLVVRT